MLHYFCRVWYFVFVVFSTSSCDALVEEAIITPQQPPSHTTDFGSERLPAKYNYGAAGASVRKTPIVQLEEYETGDVLPWAARRRSELEIIEYSAAPGSKPPKCDSKCGKCTPCTPVRVPVQPGPHKASEYYPEAWRCKCKGKLYMP